MFCVVFFKSDYKRYDDILVDIFNVVLSIMFIEFYIIWFRIRIFLIVIWREKWVKVYYFFSFFYALDNVLDVFINII